ncbi:hypothetical protein BV25DRAFT_1921529 [Artomyces pyxidatus]|uniref:Uncharacterized protein n=1 Tax=Artomyces pyxidatus TaxID=48021 RepID=A0ACB8SIB0_9AGAM|nr:hypothetical protein BV25DRAFT_1921529 [Artomyces pyxidatus]
MSIRLYPTLLAVFEIELSVHAAPHGDPIVDIELSFSNPKLFVFGLGRGEYQLIICESPDGDIVLSTHSSERFRVSRHSQTTMDFILPGWFCYRVQFLKECFLDRILVLTARESRGSECPPRSTSRAVLDALQRHVSELVSHWEVAWEGQPDLAFNEMDCLTLTFAMFNGFCLGDSEENKEDEEDGYIVV